MATIFFKGTPVHTNGDLPQKGSLAPDFQLVKTDLGLAKLSDFSGKRIVLNIFPSLDTPTCATSVRRFNQEASKLNNTVVLCISRDLPFAQARFCGAEGIENVLTLSDFKEGTFGKSYGLELVDGPLQALHSRCVIVLNENREIIYTEQVEEIVDEPKYSEALQTLK